MGTWKNPNIFQQHSTYAAALRVEVGGMSAAEIAAAYPVSRVTAWRAARSGRLHPNYHAGYSAINEITETVAAQAKPVREKKSGVVNLTALDNYEDIRRIARMVWQEMLRGTVAFEDYFDHAWDYVLASECEHLNFLGWATVTLRNAAFHVARAKRKHTALSAAMHIEETISVCDTEIVNGIEVANWCREQIISRHGIMAWKAVWAWCLKKRKPYCPKGIRKYMQIFAV